METKANQQTPKDSEVPNWLNNEQTPKDCEAINWLDNDQVPKDRKAATASSILEKSRAPGCCIDKDSRQLANSQVGIEDSSPSCCTCDTQKRPCVVAYFNSAKRRG